MGIKRRRVALVFVGVTGMLAGLLGTTGAQAARPGAGEEGDAGGAVVRTESGVVRGSTEGGTVAFQGIPYAAPPVGELRWRDPVPPAPWRGVRDATRPGPVCAQHAGELPSPSTNEDCLYLNVTAPAGRSGPPKPVIVWVHGGGFYMGVGSNYDARRMVERGEVVVVTINYRLGVFGYFGHPGLAGSGTFGLRDQQAALSWVKRNAAAFGGDPANVTVAGQSAGGISNCAQLTSPGAAGLFDKAVLQSGSCDLSWLENFEYRGQPAGSIYQPLRAVRERGRQVAAELGCTGDHAAVLGCLRALPAGKLMPQLQKFINPAYGTAVLPRDPVDALRDGRFHRVPVLAGNARDEATLSTSMYDNNYRDPMSEQTYRAVLSETFGAQEPKVRAEYPRSAYRSAARAWAAIVTDRKWACSQYHTSRRLARHVPVYQYEFADPDAPVISPEPPKMRMGAYHSSELWSLFDLGGISPGFTPEQRRLSERMIDYWTRFATTGDPEAVGAPRWPEFHPAGTPPHTQSLAPGDGGIRPVDLAGEHNCRLWSSLDR